MNILIIKPSSLGDVVQALPVLRLLKRQWPESSTYWWIDKRFAPLLEDDPDLAGIITFDRAGWRSPLGWIEAANTIAAVRRLRLDLVIDLQSLFRSGVLAWLARGERTIGLDDPREGAPAFYDAAVPRPSPTTHAVDWYLDVLRQLRVPVDFSFTWLPQKKQIAARLPRHEALIILQPGARWETKRWPARHFAETVRILSHNFSEAQFCILGSEEDRSLAAQITLAAPDRCIDLTGKTSLPEMVEWIRMSRLMITNDTGPMHVAAALNKPIIAMFGPTDPRRTGPYGRMEHVLQASLQCAPCFNKHCTHHTPVDCLRSISPAHVCEHAARVLSGVPT